MKRTYLASALLVGLSTCVYAQRGDRVYTAEQNPNTVSVIDPATNKLLGSIHLGDDVPTALSPLYRGELLVNDVVSVGSNSVTLIDTETNKVKGRYTSGAPRMRLSFGLMVCIGCPPRTHRSADRNC